MKTFILCAWLVVNLAGLNAQSVGVRLAHSLVPADHLSLKYAHWTNGTVNLCLAAFFERSHKYGLKYSYYGADLLAEYVPLRAGDPLPLFSWRVGAGVTAGRVSEPWLLKDIPSSASWNYGAVGEAVLQCSLTDIFRVDLFAQQKLLFHSPPGSRHFVFGLGLNYCLPN
jgi:hypothetical protein